MTSEAIIGLEIFDENSHPSEEEIIEYAVKIGIDPKSEAHLLPIARDGLMEALPSNWKPCLDPKIQKWYYFNTKTGLSQWEHPLDPVYRDIVKRGRSEGYSSAGEDDSKAKDLRSFEEVSDLVSSKSNDRPQMMDKKLPGPNQPLLARRKQIQSVHDPLAPRPILSSIKEVSSKERLTSTVTALGGVQLRDFKSRSVSNTPEIFSQPIQPLRRAHTLDPIPFGQNRDVSPPIKGILRESSLTSLSSRNLAKMDSVPGEIGGGFHDPEEEKKRSVRFADFEKKATEIKFHVSDSDNSGGSGDSSSIQGKPEDDLDPDSPKIVRRASVDSSSSPPPIREISLQRSPKPRTKPPLFPSKSSGKPEDSDSSQESKSKTLSVSAPSEPETDVGRQRLRQILEGGESKSSPASGDIREALLKLRPTKSPENSEKSSGSESLKDAISKLRPVRFPTKEIEDTARSRAEEKIADLQEKINKEVENKIAHLKKEKLDYLVKTEKLIKNEEDEKASTLRKDMEGRLEALKRSFESDFKLRKEEMMRNYEEKSLEIENKLKSELSEKLQKSRAEHEKDLLEKVKEEDERFLEEKLKLESETDLRIRTSSKILTASLDELKAREDAEIDEVKSKSQQVIEVLRKKYESIVDSLEDQHKTNVKKLEGDHLAALNRLKEEKQIELRRIETEWEDKLTATELQHRATLEGSIEDHERSMANLRHQFAKEEDDMKRLHAEQLEAWNIRLRKVSEKEPDIVQINRDFEKIRCEKRLLEDKYRSLKDKYMQVKSDLRLAIERRQQSKARRKREEQMKMDNKEAEKILQEKKIKVVEEAGERNFPRHSNVSALREDLTDNDPSSDDQYNSLSSAQATESEPKYVRLKARAKIGKASPRRDLPGSILENVKSQLEDLEEIEEKIPPTAHKDTYLRYPFVGPAPVPGLGTSAEVDFYRHRVLVEQEAVRAARECLLQQKRDLESRQNLLRSTTNSSTLNQLHQQERDLTEMEVSIHRTRSLLGEKMIRLRLLGQTLDRIVQNPSSVENPPNVGDFLSPGEEGKAYSSAVPFNVLQNLENINSEIREIWAHLSKTTSPQGNGSILSPSSTEKSPSERSALEARLQELRGWLEKSQVTL